MRTNLPEIQSEGKNLEEEVLKLRHKLANIFNVAFELGGPDLADDLQQAGGILENRR